MDKDKVVERAVERLNGLFGLDYEMVEKLLMHKVAMRTPRGMAGDGSGIVTEEVTVLELVNCLLRDEGELGPIVLVSYGNQNTSAAIGSIVERAL